MRNSPAIAVTLISALALSLSGCTAIVDFVHHEAEAHFDDATALAKGWDKAATVIAWLPDGATSIDTRESTQGDVAIMRFDSATPLDPALCAQTERRSLSSFDASWAPSDVVKETSVWACGTWALIPTDDGWFGWTPSAPDEQAAVPAN
jgi:hypothetical protein